LKNEPHAAYISSTVNTATTAEWVNPRLAGAELD